MDFTVKRNSIFRELIVSDGGTSMCTGLMDASECESLATQLRSAADDLHMGSMPGLVEALEETQSLLTAMLHEQRPRSEIEAQIAENRAAIAKATGEQQ